MKFRWFSVDNTLKSYTYPTIKILICVLLILLLVNRNHFFIIEKTSLKIIEGVICVCIGVASILCVYISVAEIIIVHDNRTKTENVPNKIIEECKMYSIDEIITIAETNDIVEIQIIADNRMIFVGASSDCKVGSSKFFDKQYYIDKENFSNIRSFKETLFQYSVDEKIPVTLIDGIRPE